MLTAVERLPGSKVRCLCDCGAERVVSVGHFNTGSIKSCGCHVNRHGMVGTREYITYHNMIARCHKPSNRRYSDYGGKGILVCDRWRDDFRNFIQDMGRCPDDYQIDRIDNRLGYSPENCRWVHRSQNQRNRKNSRIWIVKGQEFATANDAAKAFNVSYRTILAWCLGRKAAGRYYYPKPDCNAKLLYPNSV